mgnify:FL=1
MPLDDGFFGTLRDGTQTQEYCKFCFQDGVYLQPDLTQDDMIQMSIDNMTEKLKMSVTEAEKLANLHIPVLKRWKKQLSLN